MAVLFIPIWSSLQVLCSLWDLIGLDCISLLLVGQQGDIRARMQLVAKECRAARGFRDVSHTDFNFFSFPWHIPD